MKSVAIAAGLAAAALYGCASREHLGPRYGVATRAAFAAQVIHPDAGSQAAEVTGLDPQEAAIVSDAYFKSLTPAKQAPREEPLLILAPPQKEKLPPPMGGPK